MPTSNTLQALLWQVGWWSHVSLVTALLEMHIAQLEIKTYLQNTRSVKSKEQCNPNTIVPVVSRPKLKISWPSEQETTTFKVDTKSLRPLTPFPRSTCEDKSITTASNDTIQNSMATDPFADEFEVKDIAFDEAEEDFMLNDFYNQISPKRGFPFSRSPRLTSQLLKLVPPIDCDDVDVDYNSRYFLRATPSPSRAEAFNRPAQRALRMEWLHGDCDSPEVDTALVRSRDELSATSSHGQARANKRQSFSSAYSTWNELPSPVSSLDVASKAPHHFS